ncbi:MAG: TetR-like C-terminal domain-containing protein [Solibacillus sp.]|uniref:TetR-like C-terminal domain-containing protein n=1 Tax=unclassified Solibacillus TaxID=2637870 RepID=UPI0030F563D2
MLKNGLLNLLIEGYTLNELSVQKVTEKALLNRTTFYLHYEDINALIHQLTEEVLQEITGKIEVLKTENNINKEYPLVELLDYLYTKRHYLLVLFQLEQFEKHLFQLMKELIETRRIHSINPSRKILVDLEIKTASLVGIIMWWLKDGSHLSSDYIAGQIQQLYRS